MTYTAKELERLGRALDPAAIELRRWRRAHFMTVAELGAVLGVSARTMKDVELGMQRMPQRWLPLVAALYARWDDAKLPAAAARRAERRAKERQAIERQSKAG